MNINPAYRSNYRLNSGAGTRMPAQAARSNSPVLFGSTSIGDNPVAIASIILFPLAAIVSIVGGLYTWKKNSQAALQAQQNQNRTQPQPDLEAGLGNPVQLDLTSSKPLSTNA